MRRYAVGFIVGLALSLGATAAVAGSRFLITSTSQISPSVRSALKGAQGPEGKQGPVVAGAPGLNGTNGKDGATGRMGPEGPQGPQGIKGDQGPQGTVSISEIVKAIELTVERMHNEGKTSNITVAEVEELKKAGLIK